MKDPKIYIPESPATKAPGNDFHWNLGNDLVHATMTQFTRERPLPGMDDWLFYGATGSLADNTFFAFQFTVPYQGEELLERTYKLGDGAGLSSFHIYSPPSPPYHYYSVGADEAELSIRLDPASGTVRGDFIAKYTRDGIQLKPTGVFNLKRDAR